MNFFTIRKIELMDKCMKGFSTFVAKPFFTWYQHQTKGVKVWG